MLKRAEIANALGITVQLVGRYMRAGMPVHDVDAARVWKAANVRPRMPGGAKKPSKRKSAAGAAPVAVVPSPYQDARTRLAIAEATERELGVLERRGVLVRRATIRAELGRRLAAMRDAFLQIPARLAPVLAAETDEAKVHAALQDELFAVLAQMSEVT